jgi:hypothetical protein
MRNDHRLDRASRLCAHCPANPRYLHLFQCVVYPNQTTWVPLFQVMVRRACGSSGRYHVRAKTCASPRSLHELFPHGAQHATLSGTRAFRATGGSATQREQHHEPRDRFSFSHSEGMSGLMAFCACAGKELTVSSPRSMMARDERNASADTHRCGMHQAEPRTIFMLSKLISLHARHFALMTDLTLRAHTYCQCRADFCATMGFSRHADKSLNDGTSPKDNRSVTDLACTVAFLGTTFQQDGIPRCRRRLWRGHKPDLPGTNAHAPSHHLEC